MNLATAFQKYARGEDGQLILKFSGMDHLCKISIENGEAVYIKLGNLDVEEIIEFISNRDPVEVSFIGGFLPKKKLSDPITDRILKPGERKKYSNDLELKREYSTGEMISASKVNIAINKYVDMVGPLGAVMLQNILKKLDYTQNNPMPADDYAYMVNQLAKDVPQELRAEFMETIR
ncbi:MAG: hypothetical protein ACQEQK_00315 [Thermodesulfobacteriota bacterium]